MTQITHDTNGPGLVNYPTDLKPKDVNVYMHDSGMVATHDYSCPVCRENSAILDLSSGLMQPCHRCRGKGYQLIKKEKKLNLWHRFTSWVG